MALTGITFSQMNVTAQDDGGRQQSIFNDGYLQGCDLSFSGSSLLIQPGWFFTGGRQFKIDGVYNDLSDLNIFTLSTAIQNKDLQSIKNVLIHLLTAATVVDVEPLGLYTLLYNNFKKMIKVWLSRNPSSESTGIPSNQLWAIKNLPRVYTKDQLIKLFCMLTELDSKYKQGNFPMELLVDYLILKCLLVS